MSNETSQRVLRLTLFLLRNGAKTRAEIFEQLQEYKNPPDRATMKMLERDLKDIETAGFSVFRSKNRPAKYWVRF